MRRALPEWIAGALALVILAFGALVVVKPAIDHWDEVYRGDPFSAPKTSRTIERGSAGRTVQRTTVTREESTSFTERTLGKGGLLFLRLIVVALAAFLAAAVVNRALRGNYGMATRKAENTIPREPAFALNGHTSTSHEQVDRAARAENGRSNGGEVDGADLAPPIGKLVASRREELGLSQRELGKRAGISHTVISRLESGQQVPSPKTLERLADAFRGD
jgi:ribosome-binding protein aMBF1 (putative translation factor)